MKLLYRITIRLSICLIVVMTAWAVLFYMSINKQINKELDDMLEDYSEHLIMTKLAGEKLPEMNSFSTNQYRLHEVTAAYAQEMPRIRLKDSEAYIPFKRETEPVRMLYTIFYDKDNHYFELVVITPSIEKDDLQEAIFYWVIFLYLSLLIIVIVLNVWIYHRSMRPLHKTLAWINSYRIGTINEPLKNDTDITEFKQLNETIIESMSKMEQAFETQKQFIGNASHEIQTPIAVSINRLQMMMDDDSLTESQMTELMKTYHSLQYITKLNKSLLLLSKIDNNQFIDHKRINCNQIIKNLLDTYQEAYSHKDINIEIHEKGIFEAELNETLAAILFNNLLKNSYVHNNPGGTIIIEINHKEIIFRNTGSETILDNAHIFDRFYQGSRKAESMGLGLAIVKSICDIENLQVSYSYIHSMHCFTISEKTRNK